MENVKLKTIFNSGGIEALQRTAEIANKTAEFAKKIGLKEIRAKMPKTNDKEKLAEQGMENTLEIINKALAEYPEDTLEIVGLMTYKTLDEMKDENLALFPLIYELFSDQAVVSFLLSLLQ